MAKDASARSYAFLLPAPGAVMNQRPVEILEASPEPRIWVVSTALFTAAQNHIRFAAAAPAGGGTQFPALFLGFDQGRLSSPTYGWAQAIYLETPLSFPVPPNHRVWANFKGDTGLGTGVALPVLLNANLVLSALAVPFMESKDASRAMAMTMRDQKKG